MYALVRSLPTPLSLFRLGSVCQYLEALALAAEDVEAEYYSVCDPDVYNQGDKERGGGVIRLICVSPRVAMEPVFELYRHTLLMSGTLLPFSMYQTLLGIRDAQIACTADIAMVTQHRPVLPLVCTKGTDQVPVSTKFDARHASNVVKNYGLLVSSVCNSVPDGVIVFFPSFSYMQSALVEWNTQGILSQITASKLPFVESSDPLFTDAAVRMYKTTVDTGRGAVLFSVCRGRSSEGVDFTGSYGRAVVVVGVPYVYRESLSMHCRLQYYEQVHSINPGEYLRFDAMRAVSQCIGRVNRGKEDYSCAILADQRYMEQKTKFESLLPSWVTSALRPEIGRGDTSTSGVIGQIEQFLMRWGRIETVEWKQDGFVDEVGTLAAPEARALGLSAVDEYRAETHTQG
ncbi:xeroderma pigmentosum group D protein [Kipferlia bialata]|uniref:Xeroderma pigmentosum group D protein n=1 Tax=Kipferlia bialata TaxID=797122 RepID=A0A9K3GMF2_9EUKA|nr:xeroderma pigmentosum group D protein [Kipferlia bialata]|eukprot:g9652.t1